MNPLVKVSREGRMLRLTLNYPEKRNALSSGLCRELVEAFGAAREDAGVGCVLLDGAGTAFCAGMDLEEAGAPGASAKNEVHEPLFSLGRDFPKPIVAAAQGAALGGGIGLLANAHVVIAAQGTKFGLTEVRVGLWPLLIWRSVVAALGERRTLELSLTGRIFGTAEAQQYGLVHEVTPAFELDDRATATAQHLASLSPEVMRHGLQFAREARGMGWDAAGRLALTVRETLFQSPDFQEGVRAFREKRKPVWPSMGPS